jgi:hypothetical protein
MKPRWKLNQDLTDAFGEDVFQIPSKDPFGEVRFRYVLASAHMTVGCCGGTMTYRALNESDQCSVCGSVLDE